MITRCVSVVLLLAALPLSGCGPYPDAQAHWRAVEREARRNAPPAGTRHAVPAENACLNAAVAAGHRVHGLAPGGATGAGGVTVRVVTGSGTADLPCAYDPRTGTARIAPA